MKDRDGRPGRARQYTESTSPGTVQVRTCRVWRPGYTAWCTRDYSAGARRYTDRLRTGPWAQGGCFHVGEATLQSNVAVAVHVTSADLARSERVIG